VSLQGCDQTVRGSVRRSLLPLAPKTRLQCASVGREKPGTISSPSSSVFPLIEALYPPNWTPISGQSRRAPDRPGAETFAWYFVDSSQYGVAGAPDERLVVHRPTSGNC